MAVDEAAVDKHLQEIRRAKAVSYGSAAQHLAPAPILPLFLLARISSRVRGNPKLRIQFIKTLPLLIPVVLSYTCGEFLGYLLGPGNALEEVE